MPYQSAEEILNDSILYYRGEPVGTRAACDPKLSAPNYEECFIRDFVPGALLFLTRGDYPIVRNFLWRVMEMRAQQPVMSGHMRATGLMPASFRVVTEADGEERLLADFGELAIGRVAPVDSAMWWLFLLWCYVRVSGDQVLADDPRIQECIVQTLNLYLKESFESSPTMLVPDGSFMIDRRMGVYGHPLEIQALFYGTLRIAQQLLRQTTETARLLEILHSRVNALRSYVRLYYRMDRQRLNEIHRYQSEEFGYDAKNLLNVYPESIPEWIDDWLTPGSGYLVGNLGPSLIDFRFFAQGNLLAVLFRLATEEEAQELMRLYEAHWDTLIGEVPLKICYPAVTRKAWEFVTGSDPKNVAWSYHNGGNWPVLIWPFVAAARLAGREDLAERVLAGFGERLLNDRWPEYYDGHRGSLIGRRANFLQVWSASGFLLAHDLLYHPQRWKTFQKMLFED